MDSAAKDFQDLMVWQKAHIFVLSIYNYSDYFPQQEACGLTSQLRRAASLIPLSVGESLRAESEGEQVRLLGAARAAAAECRYYLILAKDLGYGESGDLLSQLAEVRQLLEEYGAGTVASGF